MSVTVIPRVKPKRKQRRNLTPPKRMNISFSFQQTAFLEQEQRRLGISVAELVRRIIDEYRENRQKRSA